MFIIKYPYTNIYLNHGTRHILPSLTPKWINFEWNDKDKILI